MKALGAALWILSLAAAFGLGWLAQGPGEPPQTLDSFRAALAQRSPLERAYGLSAFLRQLEPAQIRGFAEAIQQHHIGVTPEEMRLLMFAWARHDAAAAFAWAREEAPPVKRRTLSYEAAFAWGFYDGPAALAGVEALDDPDEVATLRAAVLEGWLESGENVKASAYVAGVEDPRRRRRLSFLLAGQASRDGLEAVMRWAEAVPEDAPNDFKTQAFYQATNTLVQRDPQVAVSWLEAHRSRPYSVGSLEIIAHHWAMRDGPALFAWLRGVPDGLGDRAGERADAIARGFQVWVQKAPEEAEAWLLSQLPAADLDPAVQEMARARVGEAPAEAFQWVERIQDEERRREGVQMVARVWLRLDPQVAVAWIARSDLPEDLRESLLKSPRARAAQRRAPAPDAVP